ncbi:MAG: AAA family ATPase [Pseudomonadota bacterium]
MTGIYLSDVRIENFKCFDDRHLTLAVPDGENPGSGLTVLIGENGTGKTAILEAINYTNQGSYAAENRLSINDFRDFDSPIQVTATTTDFRCKMPELYRNCYFESNGIVFRAGSRTSKSRGKLLSSQFSVRTSFKTKEATYRNKAGTDLGKPIPELAKNFSNSAIQDNELNIFYFDKNRTRQITTGTYKTNFERICDDLNWKFRKNIAESDIGELLENISGQYFANALTIAQKGTGRKLATDMADFFGQEQFLDLRIDLVELLHPFSKAFFAVRPENSLAQVAPRDLGSGVEIVLTLLLLRSISAESKGGIVYLIDEPELHLHPDAQRKLADLLILESTDKQVVVSTHSPYLLRSFMSEAVNKVILKRNETGNVDIAYAASRTPELFPWSPSWGEVNFDAYGMATVEFHNELYGWLQEKHTLRDEKTVEAYLTSQGVHKTKKWIRERNGVAETAYDITLCSYLRNSIHHPENRNNPRYTDTELLKSIETLISVLS